MKNVLCLVCCLVFMQLFVFETRAQVPGVTNAACGYCGTTTGNHAPTCPYYTGSNNSSTGTNSSGNSSPQSIISNGLLQVVFTPDNSEAQKKQLEEQRKEAERIAAEEKLKRDKELQLEHDKMMKDVKVMGSEGTKSSYKKLDSETKFAPVKFACAITSFTGQIYILDAKSGKLLQFSKNESLVLKPGDEIWTTTGKLTLHYEFENNGGKDVIVGRHSKVIIEEEEDGTQVPKLLSGKTYVRNSIVDEAAMAVDDQISEIGTEYEAFLKKIRPKFKVRTPNAVTSVRGTSFTVVADSLSGTEIMVFEGSVEVTEIISGDSIIIEAGYKADVTIEGKIIGPIKIDETTIEKWWELE